MSQPPISPTVDQPALDELQLGGERYRWLDLKRVLPAETLATLPYSMRILLENVARRAPANLPSLLATLQKQAPAGELLFHPNRLMLHDTTCLPALVDFAGLRDAVAELGGDPARVNPLVPVVTTIDHSVIVERYGTADAVEVNLDIDFRRNSERYRFIKWAEQSLANFAVVPPGTGIIHQVNMESLAQVVWIAPGDAGELPVIHPDAMVATDSHTPMINALGIVAWGVGGLEGQAAMLGEPVPIVCPEVVGVKVTNRLRPGVTATDLALHLTELLRRRGVVGKFIEFFGPGLDHLELGTRATVANMAPEYGATVVFFPFDQVTVDYLRLTGREAGHIERVAGYMKAQGLWRIDDPRGDDPIAYDSVIELDLASVEACMAGPYLPHQRQPLANVAESFRTQVMARRGGSPDARFDEPSFGEPLRHGALAIAAITSCTNTSNATLIVQAGLVARAARERGMQVKPWVKTSLSPGSRVVADYLADSKLNLDLDALGFNIVGFGCMTCIGSTGPFEPRLDKLVDDGLLVAGVLSGNRNFEGRVHPKLAGGYLASPPLVVAAALAGHVLLDLAKDPLGRDAQGRNVFLHDLWPSDEAVAEILRQHMKPGFFVDRAKTLWHGTHHWQKLSATGSLQYKWSERSTYLRRPAYTEHIPALPAPRLEVRNARALMVLGDDITTDHISPVGTIPAASSAGQWLLERGEKPEDLNQYSTRRSNHEVMLRGAFTTKLLTNQLVKQGHPPNGAHAMSADGSQLLPVYEAAATYRAAGHPLIVFAGVNYGAGSSRDWAAKAQALLGVRAVVARSFERIHRSNLIGMGVLPLVFPAGDDAGRHALTGTEAIELEGIERLQVGTQRVTLRLTSPDAAARTIATELRIDSEQERLYLMNGGILPYVMRKAVLGGKR
jgi:aconitate hydratase